MLNPPFDQPTFDIDVADDDRAQKLRQAIRGSWPSRIREDVESINRSTDWNGDVYGVAFTEGTRPPAEGTFVESLVRHGWGHVSLNAETLHVARIAPATDENTFTFEGRDDGLFNTLAAQDHQPIQINDSVQSETVSKRDYRRLQGLRQTLSNRWPAQSINRIRSIAPSTSNYSSYVIHTADSGDVSDARNPFLGKHADALLRDGWCVATVKQSGLFVSKLTPLTELLDNCEYGYRFEDSDVDDMYYLPEICGFCADCEGYKCLVLDAGKQVGDVGTPEYRLACQDCMDSEPYPTKTEYRSQEKNEE